MKDVKHIEFPRKQLQLLPHGRYVMNAMRASKTLDQKAWKLKEMQRYETLSDS
jgi:hypothetical protein